MKMAPKTRQPWPQELCERRDRILALAEARGLRHKQLAAAAGLSGNAGQVRFHRWTKGEADFDDAQWEAMERVVSGSGGGLGIDDGERSEDDKDAPGAIREGLVELDELAGAVLTDDELAGEKDELRALCRRHTRAAVGSLVRLMVSAKSEQVRARAAEALLERGFGKAIQQVVDMTPKAPAESEELIELFEGLLNTPGAPKEPAAKAEAPPSAPEPKNDAAGY